LNSFGNFVEDFVEDFVEYFVEDFVEDFGIVTQGSVLINE